MGLTDIGNNKSLSDFLTFLLTFISKFYEMRKSLIESMINSNNNNGHVSMINNNNGQQNESITTTIQSNSIIEIITNLMTSLVKIPLRIQPRHSLGLKNHLLSYCVFFSQIVLKQLNIYNVIIHHLKMKQYN